MRISQTERGEVDWKLDLSNGKEEIFIKEKRDVAIGEKVIFTRKYNEHSINKNTIAHVENVTHNKIIFKTDKKVIAIPKLDLLHIDYMYTKTFNDPVLESKSHVFVDLPSNAGSKQILHQLGKHLIKRFGYLRT